MEEKRKAGRPKGSTKPPAAVHKRTVAFPPELYADVAKIADREERDVTAQIVKVLKDFVAQYKQEYGEDLGPMVPASMAA